MGERPDPNRDNAEPTEEVPLSIREIIDSLRNSYIDPKEDFYEFEISGEIGASDMKDLLQLPFEVALTEREGKVVLSIVPGGKKSNEKAGPYRERMYNSRLSLHTHNLMAGEKIVNTPSFEDAKLSEYVDSQTPLLLVHGEGMMVYRKPYLKTKAGKKKNMGVMGIELSYGRKHGVDVEGFDKDSKPWEDLSQEEQVTFQRKFAEDTNMIVEEASWDDAEGIAKIMEYINLKREK